MGGKLPGQGLDGYIAGQSAIVRSIYLTHPARPQRRNDLVAYQASARWKRQHRMHMMLYRRIGKLLQAVPGGISAIL